MDWETPADGWYVWLGVSLVSVAVAGVVVGLPSGAPPDAGTAADGIDRVNGNPHGASAVHEYNAEEIRVEKGTVIETRNEHGSDSATLAYDPIVVVRDDYERLANVTHGTDLEDEFDELNWNGSARDDAIATVLERTVETADETDGEWQLASGELTVRKLAIEPADYGSGDDRQIADDSRYIQTNDEREVYYVTLVVL